MGFLDKAKEVAEKAKGVALDAAEKTKDVAGKAKDATTKYTGDLKEQEAKNKELLNMPMEERTALRPEGVKYCLVNNLGKILDVYKNKVVFTATKSTSSVVTALVFSSTAGQGEKTIYYKDAIGVQFKPSSVLDGYIQVETAAGGQQNSSQYMGENSIQFSGQKANEEAETVVEYIRNQIEAVKNAPMGGVVQQTSDADELKKFKELLDMGVITQEEFDAKKKQLLGL